MPRPTRKSVASKEESSSTGQRKRGAKKDEPASGDVEKQQATTSKRGGRQAAKEVQKSDASVKKKAASRGTPRGGREKKNKESESEDSDEDDESDEEEQSVSKGRGKGKSSSAAKNTNKVEQGSKAAKTGGVTARGKAGRSSRETRKHEDNDEEQEEEEDEESDEGTAVKGKSTGTRGGARQSGKTSKTEESQDETGEARPQGRAGKNRKGAKSDDKSGDAGENEQEESEEETHSAGKGRGKKGKGKAVKLEEKVEEDDDDKAEDKSKNNKSKGKGKASTVSKSGRQTTENETSLGESEEMEVMDETASESKGESLEEMETESTKSSRGQKGDSPEKSLSKARTKAGVASTSAASGKDIEKLEAEHMETVDETAATKTVKDSEKVPAESSNARKHKLEDDKVDAAKKLRLSEESESANKTEHYSDDVEGSDSQEVADLQQSAERSQPTTPEETSYDGPRINPFVATPGVPFVVPLTEAELAKQYTTQLMDRDETSSIMVEVGSECASDVTGVSTRGLEVGDIVSLDSMDLSQVEASADSSTDVISQSSSARDATFQEPCSVSAGDKLGALRNSTPVTPSANPAPTAVSSQVPTSAQSNQSPGILEVHAGSASLDSASREESSHTSSAPNQNGTVEVATGLRCEPENLVPVTYVPSSTAIDSRKFISNPSFPVDSMDPAFCFSVVSYNILADCHMRRGDYSYTQPQLLEQKYRHRLLLKELDYLDGDVVCLQEVNPDYYTQLLQPDMKSRGYEGYFIKRTKEYWDEGEATFVKTSKFDVKSHQSTSLAELAFREVDDSGLNEDISRAAKKYLDRADVILLTELNCKKTGKAVNVCNIHVVYDLKAIDVQCIQVACAIKQLVAKAGSDLHPHIICGDFNSEVTSPAYQLAKDGYLSDDHIQKLQSLQNLDVADGSSRSLIHHMWRAFQHTSSNLKSAYELTLGKEPPVTSFTKVTHATLDYIFYSAVSLDAVGVLETLDLPVVDATGGLPSDSIPSDHLSLKTVFRLK
ncbi:hypothetical protein BsWGS_12960 [Bradybaena similaris]